MPKFALLGMPMLLTVGRSDGMPKFGTIGNAHAVASREIGWNAEVCTTAHAVASGEIRWNAKVCTTRNSLASSANG
jgi:hypothetical protein